MATLTMKDWRIEDKTPYFSLGSCGENNAKTLTIQVDDIIEGAHYYLDIGDENGIGLPNTQELDITNVVGYKTITKTVTRTVPKTTIVTVTDELTGEEHEETQETEEEIEEEVTEYEEETIHYLYMKPLVSFLGKEGVKLLQVRCQYFDENQKPVTKESNVIHTVVNKNSGFVYKYDIAVFEQYLQKMRDLISKYENAINTNSESEP
jgi:hypothetical protein